MRSQNFVSNFDSRYLLFITLFKYSLLNIYFYLLQPPLEIPPDELSRRTPPEGSTSFGGKQGSDGRDDVIINMPVPVPDLHSVGGVLVHMPHVCSVCISVTNLLSLSRVHIYCILYWYTLVKLYMFWSQVFRELRREKERDNYNKFIFL